MRTAMIRSCIVLLALAALVPAAALAQDDEEGKLQGSVGLLYRSISQDGSDGRIPGADQDGGRYPLRRVGGWSKAAAGGPSPGPRSAIGLDADPVYPAAGGGDEPVADGCRYGAEDIA